MNNDVRRTVRAMMGSALGLALVRPAVSADTMSNPTHEQVVVEGHRTRDYKVDTSSISKLTEPLLDTPQTINTVSEQVMQDRAITTLNDALKNIPSITIGAGEFKTIGTSPTIRGFVARNDMFLDGLRDFGNYYRDPFNLEDVEVLEGPSSILFGRGSTGGVIEQASRLPKLASFVSGDLTLGTDSTKRLVVDVNEPLEELGEGAAVRLTAMGHDGGMVQRDVVKTSRYGFAPSLALGLGTPTRLTAAYFHQTNDDIPDYGLPYFGTQVADVPRSNFYGFKSDYMRTTGDVATLKFDHDFSERITLTNLLRDASYTRDLRFSEPLIAASVPLTTPLSAVNVTRNVNTGDGRETMLWDQLTATFRFATGTVHHVLAAGIEGGRESSAPDFFNSSGVPTTSLLRPNEQAQFTASSTYPRFQTRLVAHSVAPYAIDTIKFSSQWEATLGVRWDSFAADYNDVNFSTTAPGKVVKTDHIERTDRQGSYRGALVFKPTAHGSVYVSAGTSFDPSAEDLSFIVSSRSFNLSNADLAPEKNRSYELGTKWDLLGGHLSLTGAVFRLQKENARVPDPTNPLLNVLAGEQRVDGAELGLRGHITADWEITAGYAYLDSKVVESAPGAAPVGSPLMNTPKNSFTFWSTYQIIRGLEVGAGGRYVSSQYTQPVPPTKTVPGYWAFDAMAKYSVSRRLSVQLNVTNLTDKYYYDQLHFFHVVPAEGRTALLGIGYGW